MDTKDLQDTISMFLKNISDTQKELVSLNKISASDYKHIEKAISLLSENKKMVFQFRDEQMQQLISASQTSGSDNVSAEKSSSSANIPTSKRKPGGEKKFYLLNNKKRQKVEDKIYAIFQKYYDSTIRKFVLADESRIKAPDFIACLYDLGIKDGYASEEAPAKDFVDMVKESVTDIPSFTTAYNTVARVIKSWRYYIGVQGYVNRNIHLYSLTEDNVIPKYRDEFLWYKDMLGRVSKAVHKV